MVGIDYIEAVICLQKEIYNVRMITNNDVHTLMGLSVAKLIIPNLKEDQPGDVFYIKT